jgi:hypothetical protein
VVLPSVFPETANVPCIVSGVSSPAKSSDADAISSNRILLEVVVATMTAAVLVMNFQI